MIGEQGTVEDMDPTDEPRNLLFERFRAYLLMLTHMQLGGDHRGKIEASDIVQQTMLEAHRKRDQFRGQTDAELASWLRSMLVFSIADAFKTMNRGMRNPAREQSLQADLDASSARLENWLSSDQSSPSQEVQRHEQLLRLAEALAQLPEKQREALVLRHCQGRPLNEIAQRLGITASSVVGLIQRGTKQLRKIMAQME